ncbi:MAG TPA: hypothetical protein VIF14_05280 [Alphaproteobacteria bacterium]
MSRIEAAAFHRPLARIFRFRCRGRRVAGIRGPFISLQDPSPRILLVDEIKERAAAVEEALRRAGTPAALVDGGTTRNRRVIAGTIASLAQRAAAAGTSEPALLIVGEVAAAAARAASANKATDSETRAAALQRVRKRLAA